MAVLIELPLSYYRTFFGYCLLNSREYEVLKNAIIDHLPKDLRDGNVVAVLCSEDDAKLLSEQAKRFYPNIAPYIEQALTPAAQFRRRVPVKHSSRHQIVSTCRRGFRLALIFH